MQNDNETKDAVLASTNTEETVELHEGTIKAENLKDNTSAVNKRDLSAIIPQQAIEGSEVDGTLQSKENLLKGDGAIVIGNINNGEAQLTSDAKFPEMINIEQRKKEQLDLLKAKKSNQSADSLKKKISESTKRAQTISSLIALAAIAIIAGAYYFFTHVKTDKDFTPKNVVLEIGAPIPVHSIDYVNPGIGVIDDMAYTINTSNVIFDQVGEYEFTVTYKGIAKKGKLSIVDTTPPEIKTKDITIVEGQGYTVGKFFDKCVDPSGCEFSFANAKDGEYTAQGTYEKIVVIAKDPYGNESKGEATLTIKNRGNLIKYSKTIPPTQENNYEKTIIYEMYFSDYSTNNILYYANLNEISKYSDEVSYSSNKQLNKEDPEYSFDDSNFIITRKTQLNTIGRSLSEENAIINYLTSEGYIRAE